MATDSNSVMQRITHQQRRQTSPKKSQTLIQRIVDLVKSPGSRFDWPEFMPPAKSMYVDKRIEESTRQLPLNLRRHLRQLARNWHDEWTGKQLNNAFESYGAASDPLYAELPPQITMFETGQPLLVICDRYQEIRRWREILLRIARGKFGFYLGERIIGMNDKGAPIADRDELTRALNQLEDWRKIRECSKCGSIYLETRSPLEPACPPPAKCRQRARHSRNPRPQRPPSRLEDVQRAIENYCKGLRIRRFERTPENIEDLSEASGMRPSTIKRCLDYLEAQTKAGQNSAQTLKWPFTINPSIERIK